MKWQLRSVIKIPSSSIEAGRSVRWSCDHRILPQIARHFERKILQKNFAEGVHISGWTWRYRDTMSSCPGRCSGTGDPSRRGRRAMERCRPVGSGCFRRLARVVAGTWRRGATGRGGRRVSRRVRLSARRDASPVRRGVAWVGVRSGLVRPANRCGITAGRVRVARRLARSPSVRVRDAADALLY
jgi:hypothetical protein